MRKEGEVITRRPWTDQEDAQVREAFASGGYDAVRDLAPTLNRTRAAVAVRVYALGLKPGHRKKSKAKRLKWGAKKLRPSQVAKNSQENDVK